MLPHAIIKLHLFALIDLCFKNAGKVYTAVGNSRVWYSDIVIDQATCYRKEEVMDLLSIVLDETYVVFAGIVFRQVCGVPMGGNASPLIADLALSMMEFQFAKTEMATNHEIPFWDRYIDDILAANCQRFMQIAPLIYHSVLVLKRTNATLKAAPFLDLSIDVSNGLNISVYNKTDDFSFKVVKYGFADSNVHINVGLGTFYSQLVRFARISNKGQDFERRVLEIFMEFVDHGFSRDSLISKFFHFVQRARSLLFKFGLTNRVDILRFVDRVFCR